MTFSISCLWHAFEGCLRLFKQADPNRTLRDASFFNACRRRSDFTSPTMKLGWSLWFFTMWCELMWVQQHNASKDRTVDYTVSLQQWAVDVWPDLWHAMRSNTMIGSMQSQQLRILVSTELSEAVGRGLTAQMAPLRRRLEIPGSWRIMMGPFTSSERQEHDEVWQVSKTRLQYWPRLYERHIHQAGS